MSTGTGGAGALGNRGVLVTRAAHQAGHLCDLIEMQGGRTYRLPVLEILPPGNGQTLAAVRARLSDYDLAVFVSANAVRMAFPALGPVRQWPQQLGVAAIGRQTAAALDAAGVTVSIVPQAGFTSEALLALDGMRDVDGKNILIVRGEGGREYLARELRERGAQVDYAEVYRRVLPEVDTSPILEVWRQGNIDAVTIASLQSLENLQILLGEHGTQLLQDTLLVVGNRRTAEWAGARGYARIVIADDASDEAMVAALEQSFSS